MTRFFASRQYFLRKNSTSWGISSFRSRNGGSVIVTTLSRKKRSSRKAPVSTALSRSRLVAAITLTSTLIARVPPTRSNSRF